MKILLVDDEELQLLRLENAAKKVLPDATFCVYTNPLKIISDDVFDYDIAFLDIEMPVMNGVESTAAIRAHESPNTRTPIIALTAHTEDEITEDLSSAGFTDMIGKPFLLGKIKHLIDTYCR